MQIVETKKKVDALFIRVSDLFDESWAKDFYDYAQEININISVKTDLYVKNQNKLANISKLTIGIPRGNEDFASELLGIDKKQFYVGELENLLKMLDNDRIDAVWFERSSVMSSLKLLKIRNIYYMQYPKDVIRVGLAVRKDQKGNLLKQKIEEQLNTQDFSSLLKDYNRFLNMPDKGSLE